MWRSPAAAISRSRGAWRAICSSMWSKKPTPVEIRAAPNPSRSSATEMFVSEVLRSIALARMDLGSLPGIEGGRVVSISAMRRHPSRRSGGREGRWKGREASPMRCEGAIQKEKARREAGLSADWAGWRRSVFGENRGGLGPVEVIVHAGADDVALRVEVIAPVPVEAVVVVVSAV